MSKTMSALFGAVFLAASAATTASAEGLPTIAAKRSAFFVGGAYSGEAGKEIMRGQMYVEYLAPKKITQKYPLVLVHGAAWFCGLEHWHTRLSYRIHDNQFVSHGFSKQNPQHCSRKSNCVFA